MKKLFSIILLLYLTSCSFFPSEKIQENDKNIQNIPLQKKEQYFLPDEKIVEPEKKMFDLVEINNIKLDNIYISNLKKVQTDLGLIKRELNGLSISLDALLFLKWRCEIMGWGKKYYDWGKIKETSNDFDLKQEYLSSIENTDVKWQELERSKNELNNLFSKNFSELHLKIANTNSYKEVISLMWINKDNLKFSLDKYSIILILTNKSFDEKKYIFNDIFKSINKKGIDIDDNHLSGILYLYFYSKKGCDGFFDYLNNEFNL